MSAEVEVKWEIRARDAWEGEWQPTDERDPRSASPHRAPDPLPMNQRQGIGIMPCTMPTARSMLAGLLARVATSTPFERSKLSILSRDGMNMVTVPPMTDHKTS